MDSDIWGLYREENAILYQNKWGRTIKKTCLVSVIQAISVAFSGHFQSILLPAALCIAHKVSLHIHIFETYIYGKCEVFATA